jgi:hypothetical protein
LASILRTPCAAPLRDFAGTHPAADEVTLLKSAVPERPVLLSMPANAQQHSS